LDAGSDAGSDAGVDGGTPACDPALGTNACGGLGVGNWQYAGACSNSPAFGSTLFTVCPGATMGPSTYTTSGTLVIDIGTYTRNVTTTGSELFAVPPSCASSGCAALATMLEQLLTNTTVMCTADPATNGCNCTASRRAVTNDSGSYTMNGNIITAGGVSYYYCDTAASLTYHAMGNDPSGYDVTYTLSPR
jgi:hypothetical protein